MKYYNCNTLVIYLSTNIKTIKKAASVPTFAKLFNFFKLSHFYIVYKNIRTTRVLFFHIHKG